MKLNGTGIATGGWWRLRKAVQEKVRRKYQEELAAAVDKTQKKAIKERIQREIEAEMGRVGSPFSLWGT